MRVGVDKVDLDALEGDYDTGRDDGDGDVWKDPMGVILRRPAVEKEAARDQ